MDDSKLIHARAESTGKARSPSVIMTFDVLTQINPSPQCLEGVQPVDRLASAVPHGSPLHSLGDTAKVGVIIRRKRPVK